MDMEIYSPEILCKISILLGSNGGPLVVNLPSKGLVVRNLKEIFKVGVGHSWDIWGQKMITAQQCK